jgi:YD repeat-containing protein
MQSYKNLLKPITLGVEIAHSKFNAAFPTILFILLCNLPNDLLAQTPLFAAPTISSSTIFPTEWTISWSSVSGPVDHYDLYSSNSRGRGRVASLPVSTRFYKQTLTSEYLDFEVQACNASNQCGTFSSKARIETSKVLGYEYDALGRLTFTKDSVNGNRDYDYDAAGNRLLVRTGVASDDAAEPVDPASLLTITGTTIGTCCSQGVYKAQPRALASK